MINHLRDWIFKNVHGSNLVYNICWEDPRCDRQIMNIGEDSKIVMITSAGCNALDYLLDNPAEINCIDLNSRQNALMEFKKALFKHSDYKTLYNFFLTRINLIYPKARRRVIKKTGLSPNCFPEQCPFSVEQILDLDFYHEL